MHSHEHRLPIDEPALLVRPKLARTEGPKGYLLRLAEANCLHPHDLVQMGAAFSPSWLERNRLLPDSTLDPDLIAWVNRVAEQIESNPRIWNHRQTRFCPLCLAEDPTWQAGWELLFHDACPTHSVWLVDECTSCGLPIGWSREHLLRCSCGADLRREVSKSAPDSVCHLSEQLSIKLAGKQSDGRLQILDGLSLDQTQRLVRYLGGYMDPVSGPKPLKLRNAFSMSASWPVTSLAAELLAKWPESFHECWSRMYDPASNEKVSLNGAFKQAHSYLYKGFKEAAFNPFRDAFEQWLSWHWKGGLSRKNRLADQLLATAQWIPAQAAAAEIGVSSKKIRSMVRAGFLEGQESVSDGGRRFMVVRRDQLQGVLDQLAGEITMGKAMEMLGLGKIRTRRLLKLLFPNARRTSPADGMPWCVPLAEVDKLLALGADLPRKAIADEDEVVLAHVLRYWMWTTEQVVSLIDAVSHGQFQPTSVCDDLRGITGWIFNRDRLKAWRTGLDNGMHRWLTVVQLASALQVKQHVAYWLCKNEYLPSEKLGKRSDSSSGALGTRIRMEEVERFRADHMFARDLATLLSTTSRKVARVLEEERIHPLRGSTDASPPMLIYRRNKQLGDFLYKVDAFQDADGHTASLSKRIPESDNSTGQV